MGSSLCQWLKEAEETLWRMIRGIPNFIFVALPRWIYNAIIHTLGPAVIRGARVMVALCLWLGILIVPVFVAIKLLPFGWDLLASFILLVLFIGGSIWGYCRQRRKWREAKREQENDDIPYAMPAVESRR